MRMLAPIAAAIVVWALVGSALSGGATSTPTQRTAEENRAAAAHDAATRLGLTPLPSGAAVSSSDPTAGGALGMPAQSMATPDLVDLTRWWLVPGQPDATFAFIKSHPPKNSKPSAIGFFTTGSGVMVRFIGFQWQPQPGVTDSRTLLVEETAAPNGQTAVRADAEVVWVLPRPASEQIPSDARLLTVSVRRAGKHVTSVTVSKPSTVRRLAAVIDSLETVQPYTTSCSQPVRNGPKISFSFRATRTGPPLAVARETYNPKAPGTFPCDPMTFSINGKPQTPLLDPTGTTIRTATKLLGKLP